MNAFTSHFSFEYRTGIRDRTLLLMNYLLPLGLYLMLGFLLTELNPYFDVIVMPAMIVIAILFSLIIGLPNPLLAAREAGIFRSYKINGVPAVSILAIPALTTILHTMVVAAIITATAPPLFGALRIADWIGFGVFFLLTAFVHAGLGMLISVVSSSTRTVVLWSQLILLPSMMLGVMIPLHDLPAAFEKVALFLPATHAMNIFQGLAVNQTTAIAPAWSALILLTGGLLSFGLANYLFCWDSRNKARRGHPALALLALLPYVLGVVLL